MKGPLQNLNIKPGDVVRCVKAATWYFTKRKEYDVVTHSGDVGVLDDDGDFIRDSSSIFEKVEPEKYPRPPHKHRDLIIEIEEIEAEMRKLADRMDKLKGGKL